MTFGEALIIEDSDTQAKLIGRLIEREQWGITHVKSLDVAYHYLKTTRVNLILLDVFLEEMNSLPLIARVKGLAPDTALAVMTAGSKGEALEATLRAARQSEADYVLRKPFDARQIQALIGDVARDQKLGRRRPHAVVVDDCRVVRHIAFDALADNGYRVTEARTMEEALANPEIAHVDIVITDVFMPGMGGIEGTRIIKTTWPRVKVIAMSAGMENHMPSEQVLEASVRIGADARLNKPFRPENLLAMVNSLVA